MRHFVDDHADCENQHGAFGDYSSDGEYDRSDDAAGCGGKHDAKYRSRLSGAESVCSLTVGYGDGAQAFFGGAHDDGKYHYRKRYAAAQQ